jgi:uncharacterized membrane protein YoaK (UPF0700 family)
MSWRRAPLWIAFGGAALALSAGYVNAIGYLGIARRGVSHVTGQVTQIGIDLMTHDGISALRAAALVLAFFCGAVLSGALIRTAEISDAVHRRYGAALLVESFLLGIGALMLATGRGVPELFVAMAMGLQNAMASTYSGTIVRTTHVTGVATDLGILLGQLLRGGGVEAGRVQLLALLLGSFALGGALGAATFSVLGPLTLVPPAVGLALVALIWLRLARPAS